MHNSFLDQRYPNNEKFKLGDNKTLCTELTALVRRKKKTATCGAFRDLKNGKEAMPNVGRIDLVLNWDGTPALAIRTVSVEIIRFCDVTEEFALKEGENQSLKEWQQDHKAYFERNGGFDPQMELVCECFELIEVLE